MTGISYIKALGRMFYPVVCPSCNEALMGKESCLCTLCRVSLPVTGFHTIPDNPLNNLLKLRMRVDFISSYLFYDKGLSTQNMLHAIKYKGHKKLASLLGELYGYDLHGHFEYHPDFIIPVPLHNRRRRERGYNQSEEWATGLSKSLQSPVNTEALLRVKYTTTQTKKSRTDRINNVATAFKITSPQVLKGKSVLLVDDVITTGATLEACGTRLWEAGIKSLNIATIAYAIK